MECGPAFDFRHVLGSWNASLMNVWVTTIADMTYKCSQSKIYDTHTLLMTHILLILCHKNFLKMSCKWL